MMWESPDSLRYLQTKILALLEHGRPLNLLHEKSRIYLKHKAPCSQRSGLNTNFRIRGKVFMWLRKGRKCRKELWR